LVFRPAIGAALCTSVRLSAVVRLAEEGGREGRNRMQRGRVRSGERIPFGEQGRVRPESERKFG